jgi:Phage gp6-like head-tail connector protein
MSLVSLVDAKAHLRLSVDDLSQDATLTATLAAAEAIILDFLNTTEAMRAITETWDAASVPFEVSAAIKLELGELWRFRGDDVDPPKRWDGTDLSPVILGLLRRWSPMVLH